MHSICNGSVRCFVSLAVGHSPFGGGAEARAPGRFRGGDLPNEAGDPIRPAEIRQRRPDRLEVLA